MYNPIVNVIAYEWIKEYMTQNVVFNTKDVLSHIPFIHLYGVNKMTKADLTGETVNVDKLIGQLATEFNYKVNYENDDHYLTAWPKYIWNMRNRRKLNNKNSTIDNQKKKNTDINKAMKSGHLFEFLFEKAHRREEEELEKDILDWIEEDRYATYQGYLTIPIRLLRLMYAKNNLIEGPNPGDIIYAGMYGAEVVLSRKHDDVTDAKKGIFALRVQKDRKNGKLTINMNGVIDGKTAFNKKFDISYDPNHNNIHILPLD